MGRLTALGLRKVPEQVQAPRSGRHPLHFFIHIHCASVRHRRCGGAAVRPCISESGAHGRTSGLFFGG